MGQAEGEIAVKEEFPEATIIRPAKLFGNDDRMLAWIAQMATKLGNVPLVRPCHAEYPGVLGQDLPGCI